MPRRDGDALLVDDEIDLAAFASLLQRPLAYEPSAGIAVLADSPAEHAATISGGAAPTFTLPDLDGHPVPSTTFSGKKKLYVAWSSW